MATQINETTTRFNGFYIMDYENSESGYVIIGITYPNGNEALIDPMSISNDFDSFTAETKSMYNCGLRVCRRYETLQAAYFAWLMATRKGVA